MRAHDHGGRSMILRGEDVARGPPDVRAERDEGLDQDCGLHRHVQRTGDARTLQRQNLCVLATQRHQPGHLVLGQTDLFAAELGQRQIGDLEIEPVDLVGDERGVRHCADASSYRQSVDAHQANNSGRDV